MIEFVGYLETSRRPEEAFDLLADMAELHRWNPNVTSSRRVDGDRLSIGSTYLSTVRRGPIVMTARSTLTAVETGRSVTYEGSISGFWSIDSLRFDTAGEGTRITFENSTRPPGWLRMFGPILDTAFQPQALRAVEGARRYLDASG